ncbi:MAG: type II toxin-antitoxin system VapC family toxin [Gammaproteobacteria bacterium]|nr:type II toxin-antitoxin system VapC family toxin [Gammaproteobacteria bacterium]
MSQNTNLKMRAINTNVLARALVRDDAAQTLRAEALLTSGE